MPVTSRSRQALAADDEGGMATDFTFGVGSLVTVVPRSEGGSSGRAIRSSSGCGATTPPRGCKRWSAGGRRAGW